MKNKNHVITRKNIEQEEQKSTQRDVVIPNELGNSENCQGLRHWRLLSNLKNNFSRPARNDMGRHPEGTRAEDVRREPYPFNASVKCPKDLQTQNHVITRKNIEQEMQKSTQSDVVIPNKLDNGETCQGLLRRFVHKITNNNEISPHNDMVNKNRNKLINLSPCRIIDLKSVTNLFPYFPISFSLNKKLRRFRILSWIIGGSAGSTQPSPGRATLSFRSCQNPQSGMTFIKQAAFTLAEVLITLGIIGVVAAITIPGLMTKYHRSVVEKKLIKFESIMNQAIRMSIAENDDLVFSPPENVSERTPYMKEWLQENLLKFMKAEYDGEVINNRYYKISFIDGTGVVVYPANRDTRIHFFFCLEAKDATCKQESYDGRNTFVFVYDQKTKAVLPYGYEVNDVNKLKNNTASTAVGCYTTAYPTHRHYCAQLIKQNGWKIPADYPWIK